METPGFLFLFITVSEEIGSFRDGKSAGNTQSMAAISPNLDCTAILVAAGTSRRMGFDKLGALLAGIPVLQRTLEAFLEAESISEIIIVCASERWELLGDGQFCKPVRQVDGAVNRQESVALGLAEISTRYVAVHDGARPFVTTTDIDRCVASAKEHHAAALARRVTETMKRSDNADFSVAAISRENLWLMETPQVFETILLREAYAAVLARGLTVTDEASAIEAIGKRVKLIQSTRNNLKITTPADLALAEALLR